MPHATLSPCPKEPVATSMKFNLIMMLFLLVVLAAGVKGVPWGRMAFEIGINFSEVHQFRSRKKSSLV